MPDPRETAAKALLKIERDKAYSNITVAGILREGEFDERDKALVSALVYGVLDRKITLDYVLCQFVKNGVQKIKSYTLTVLRLALYQIMFMDKIPPSAAVNEAVNLIKKSKERYNSGFVNAVLRSVLRSEIKLPEGSDTKSVSIRYSCPQWIVESFIRDYGVDNTVALLEKSLQSAPVTLRVNTIKTDSESLKVNLKAKNIEVTDGGKDNSLIVNGGFRIESDSAYINGEYYIQDTASQNAAEILNPKPNERVLDMCAAPGGKSFTMACLMENKGEIISCDLYPHKIKLIEDSAKRLGINIIKAKVCDASVYDETLGEFDCILCDVPCSGLGVLRRKPEIKYKENHDFASLQKIQYEILSNASKYLKKSGRILYSTCTLRKEENEEQVLKFLKEHRGFTKEYEHTFMPHIDGTDGFYCALLTKI